MAKTETPCCVEDCDRVTYSTKCDTRGLCRHHHGLVRRFGDVNAGEREMLFALVDKRGPDECWEWLGARLPAGYGYFHNKYPHRMSWEFERGPIPAGLDIDHRCHNLVCVKPSTPASGHAWSEHGKPTRRAKEQSLGPSRRDGLSVDATSRGHAKMARIYYLGSYGSAAEAAEVARQKRLELFTHNDLDRQSA